MSSPLQLIQRALYITGYGNRIKKIPMIAEGPANTQGSKVKHASRVRATQSNQSEGRSNTKGS
jgi:hypothetical protein